MAEITPTGVVEKTFSEYLDDIQNTFKDAFGGDLEFGDQTPQGQITWLLAKIAHDFDQNVVDIARSLDIIQATGQQLDDLASILGVFRRGATHSTVTANLTGTSGTVIPAGSIASTVNGDRFVLDSDVEISSTGTASGYFVAEELGAIYVGAGELTEIVTTIYGWDSVSNPTAGSMGADDESDADFTARYYSELFSPSISMMDSIIGNVSRIDEVQSVAGLENPTSSQQLFDGIPVAPHGFIISAEGGDGSEIASVIRERKSLGSAPYMPVMIQFKTDSSTSNVTIEAGTVFSDSNGVEFVLVKDVKIESASTEKSEASYCNSDGSITAVSGTSLTTSNQSGYTAEIALPNGEAGTDYSYVFENYLVPVYTPNGSQVVQNIPVAIKRIEPLPVKISIYGTKYEGFPANGVSMIRDAIVEYIEGTNQFTNKFELDGMKAGETLYASRLYTPVNSVKGFSISSSNPIKIWIKSEDEMSASDSVSANIAQRIIIEDPESDIIIALN